MQAINSTNSTTAPLAPVSVRERIEALDVVRGFALIGIFLMNVEWFTRPISELGTGVDIRQSGLDYAASWFVYTFVQGKFWTLFSLLFGMGFAVMLSRAESAQRAFVTPYIRRVLALFLFGSAHFVMIWTGDILHNYAITALALLLIVTRSWKAWLAMLAAAITTAVWLKSDSATMGAAFLAAVGLLMFFLNRGSIDRYYKFGVAMYLLPFLLGLAFVGVTTVVPALNKPPTAKELQERAERRAERVKDGAEDTRVHSKGSYMDTLDWRVGEFREALPNAVGMSFMALPMFMIGFWFVRSGVVVKLRENLPLFKRLLRWTLPLGVGLTLASVWLHSSFAPGTGRVPSVAAARILFELGTLPLTMAYLSGLICLLATTQGARILSPLRFAGRMALTNYLGASLISAWFFYGHGLGFYEQVSRGSQVIFVAVVFALQLVFSYLWLSRFRYGPMEWLWRAATYWQLPAMRRSTGEVEPSLSTRAAQA